MTPRASILLVRGRTHRHAKTSCRAREFVRDSLELKMAPLFSSCFERVSGKRSDFDRFGRLAAFTGARVGLAARRRGDAMSRTFTPVESSNRPPHDCGKNPFCVICPETGRRSRPRRRGRRKAKLDEDYVLFSESSQLGSVGRGLAQKRRDALRTELAQARK